MGAPIPIIVESKKFNSLIEACKYYSIDASLVKYRVKKGSSLEAAFIGRGL